MNKNTNMLIRLLSTNRLFKESYFSFESDGRTEDELKDIWRHNGILMGYPECCINSFCDQPLEERTENQHKIGELRFGFIPCITHANSVINGDITLESLITNRDSSLKPFPQE